MKENDRHELRKRFGNFNFANWQHLVCYVPLSDKWNHSSPSCEVVKRVKQAWLIINNILTQQVLCLAQVGMNIDLVESKVLPVRSYKWTSRCFDVNNSKRVASKVWGFKEGSAYSKVRWRLKEVLEEPKVDGLMLVVQGRLAWGKVKGNYEVYILLLWEVWLNKRKAGEGNRTISNTVEYSGKNILESNG